MHGRSTLLLSVLLSLPSVVGSPRGARAEEPPVDDGPAAHRLDWLDHVDGRDATLGEAGVARAGDQSPFWVALSGKLSSHEDHGRDYGAMVVVGAPLERFARPRVAATRAADPSPRGAKSAPSDDDVRLDRDDEPHADLQVEPDEPPRAPPRTPLSPSVVRGAVRAALVERGLIHAVGRVDSLESRSRASALLPELRLRVTRLVDEDERISPTEYDPNRTMASGGTSLWMEARATWKLDRLVFADDEVALARLRVAQRRERRRAVADVLSLLIAWQRAVAHATDEWADPDERWKATLDAESAALSLDVETGGWFSRWQERRASQRERE